MDKMCQGQNLHKLVCRTYEKLLRKNRSLAKIAFWQKKLRKALEKLTKVLGPANLSETTFSLYLLNVLETNLLASEHLVKNLDEEAVFWSYEFSQGSYFHSRFRLCTLLANGVTWSKRRQHSRAQLLQSVSIAMSVASVRLSVRPPVTPAILLKRHKLGSWIFFFAFREKLCYQDLWSRGYYRFSLCCHWTTWVINSNEFTCNQCFNRLVTLVRNALELQRGCIGWRLKRGFQPTHWMHATNLRIYASSSQCEPSCPLSSWTLKFLSFQN